MIPTLLASGSHGQRRGQMPSPVERREGQGALPQQPSSECPMSSTQHSPAAISMAHDHSELRSGCHKSALSSHTQHSLVSSSPQREHVSTFTVSSSAGPSSALSTQHSALSHSSHGLPSTQPLPT